MQNNLTNEPKKKSPQPGALSTPHVEIHDNHDENRGKESSNLEALVPQLLIDKAGNRKKKKKQQKNHSKNNKHNVNKQIYYYYYHYNNNTHELNLPITNLGPKFSPRG